MYVSRLSNYLLENRPVHSEQAEPGGRDAPVSGSTRFGDLVRLHFGLQPELEGATAPATTRNRRTPFDMPLPAAPEAPPAAARPGVGLVTESGAPRIVPAEPHPGYNGPAAVNPYFGSPLREGNVAGFANWFQSIEIGGLGAFTWPPCFSATAEAAQEALRLVQQYVPEAKIEAFVYNSQIGSTPSHAIELPNGEQLNAGLLLDSYYHQGHGVDSNSDAMLRADIAWLTGTQPVEPVGRVTTEYA
jgi:hypothetical protein